MLRQYTGILTTLFVNSLLVLCADVSDEKKNDNIVTKFPGINFELTIEVAAKTEDCFYQHIALGSNMYVYFEVVRGGDRKIDFTVRDPNYRTLEMVLSKTEGQMQTDTKIEGVYSVCLDNTFSRFSSKLVMLFLYVTVHSDWLMYSEKVEELKNISNLIKSSLGEVETSISEMKRYQSRLSSSVIRDWHLVSSNMRYIVYYSVLQCIVIVISACTQVYLLRRFFRTVKVTPTLKPRA